MVYRKNGYQIGTSSPGALEDSPQPLRMRSIEFTEGGFYQPRSARCIPVGNHPSMCSLYLPGVVGLAAPLQGVVAHAANAA